MFHALIFRGVLLSTLSAIIKREAGCKRLIVDALGKPQVKKTPGRFTFFPVESTSKQPVFIGGFSWMMNQIFTSKNNGPFHHFHPLKTIVL